MKVRAELSGNIIGSRQLIIYRDHSLICQKCELLYLASNKGENRIICVHYHIMHSTHLTSGSDLKKLMKPPSVLLSEREEIMTFTSITYVSPSHPETYPDTCTVASMVARPCCLSRQSPARTLSPINALQQARWDGGSTCRLKPGSWLARPV